MKQILRWSIWALLILASVVLLETPLRRAWTMIELAQEDLRGPLAMPVQGVGTKQLRDTWGASRSEGRSHQGIDIFAACGRPVQSATRGVIVRVGENKLGGQIVGVFGPGASFHYYAHLSRFADVSMGDEVEVGDLLGYVGNTGNAQGTPCHLHYGIYKGGKAQNPYPLLAPNS